MLLLTGATGFVGSNILQVLLERKWSVRAFSRRCEPKNLPVNLQWIQGELKNFGHWANALKGVDTIVHTAAEILDESQMRATNFDGPSHLLDSAIKAGVERWIQISSVGSYGPVVSGVVDETWPDNPISVYERSKTDFDRVLECAAARGDIDVYIIRPSNVYGPGMTNPSIRKLVDVLRKDLFFFLGSPGASANYIHVDDVVKAVMLCVSQRTSLKCQKFIVSTTGTIEELISGISEGLGIRTPSKRIPLSIAFLLAYSFRAYPKWPLTVERVRALSNRCRYNTRSIEEALGWRPEISVKDGFKQLARKLSQ